MCGLVGVAGKISYKEKDMLKELLVINSLRGVHSTGVSVIDFNGAPKTFKRATNPYELFEHKAFDQVWNWGGPRCIIGHGRHATVGGRSHWNAHPFEFRNIVGAHNGTIPDYSIRRLNGGQVNYYDTDSEAIYSDMNDGLNESGEDWKTPLVSTISNLSGAYALTFFLTKHKRLCLIRNEERPLFYVYTKDRETMFWASELWMLHGVFQRNKVEMEGNPFVLNPNRLLSWEIPHSGKLPAPSNTEVHGWVWSNTGGKSDLPFRKEDETKRTAAHTVPALGPNGASSTSQGSSTDDGLANVRYLHRSVANNIRKEMSPHTSGHFKTPYKDHRGRVLKKVEFEELIEKAGECTYCPNQEVKYGEECLILAPAPDGKPRFLCSECVKDDEVLQICRGMR